MLESLELRTIEVELRALVGRHGPRAARIEIVASVPEWSIAHGIDESNPFRQAKSFPDTGLIVVAGVLTMHDAQASASVLNLGPIAHDALARDLRLYACFLVLHEVAHLRGVLDEPSADKWALETLNAYLAERSETQIPT